MILIALGSNQSGPWGTPREAVARAIAAMNGGGIRVKRASTPLVSAPFGVEATNLGPGQFIGQHDAHVAQRVVRVLRDAAAHAARVVRHDAACCVALCVGCHG